MFSVFLFKKSKKSEIGKRVSVRSSQLSPLYSSSKSGGGEKEERKREGELFVALFKLFVSMFGLFDSLWKKEEVATEEELLSIVGEFELFV